MTNYRRAFLPGATWFFTVNLLDRSSDLLVERIDDLREAVRHVRRRHPFGIEAMVVLPDHVHAVWTLPQGDADFPLRWSLFKSTFSRRVPMIEPRSTSRIAKRERGIWQRRYWEHLVRDEQDLQRHVDYVHFNPVKHGHVRRVGEWPHSTFHRHVANGLLDAAWGDVAMQEGRFGER